MKNPAIEQPARTNSQSLLFRHRGRLSTAWPYKAGAWAEDFTDCVALPVRPDPLFCLAGHVRKGAHDQRNPQATAGAAWEAKERSTRC